MFTHTQAMQMFNLTLVGGVVADPITKEINGKEATFFRIIYNQKVNGKKEIIIFDCAAFNGLGKIAQLLSKGRLVGLTSNEFSQNIWSANGKSGINNRLIVNSINLLDKKPDCQNQDNDENTGDSCPF